jgi:Fic family protein
MMKSRDGASLKRERIETIYGLIPKTAEVYEQGLKLSVFLSSIVWHIGLSEKTSLKYLQHLENLGFIRVKKSLNLIEVISKT